MSVNIEIKSTFPPQFLCDSADNETCIVQIEAYLQSTKDDYTCDSGRVVSQAVIGWTHSDNTADAFCGLTLNSFNWFSTLTLPVKAMMDGLNDKDQTRTLIIYERHYVEQVLTTEVEISSIEVNIVNRDREVYCSSHNDPHYTTFDKK